MRVLLVEDEPEMAAALTVALKNYDMVVDHISMLADAEEAVFINDYGAILLDRQLPDGDGLTLIPKLRARGAGVPVIVLTARGELADRIAGVGHRRRRLSRQAVCRRRAAGAAPRGVAPAGGPAAGNHAPWPAVVRPRQPGSQASPASRSICRAANFWCWKPCCAGWAARSRVRRWRRRSTASMTRSSRTRWIPMSRGCGGNYPRQKRKLKSTAFAASAIC